MPNGELTIFEEPVVTVKKSNSPAAAPEINKDKKKNITVYIYKAGLLNQYLISLKNIFKNIELVF